MNTSTELTTEQMETLDTLVRKHSAFNSAQELLDAQGDYNPSVEMSDSEKELMADLYDLAQELRGDKRRAYRYGDGWKWIFAYKNTASTKGIPEKHRIYARQIIRCRKWYDHNGNPSYGYLMQDGTTYLLDGDYDGSSILPPQVGVDMVKRKKDLVGY